MSKEESVVNELAVGFELQIQNWLGTLMSVGNRCVESEFDVDLYIDEGA